ncbi:MAG TPA: ABC transporter permease [Candidatus Avipropionibacterium avicola]|uniref:Cell division protein FtsX n=1 Tax=Candidatus Avipropionibacterium avicola TaxID=2840701 RepID=A0A9D1KLQ2_9ACTN|nr:ABC transporter permease [Candidatus Avipropionibacterium avicola]
MRHRHILSETWSGLRRNLTMTLAVIVTMWVSLALFGAGLLAYQQVDLMKGRWYDKVEISVFLCGTVSAPSETCEGGQDATEAQKEVILATLENNPEVADVHFESKQEAFEEFRKAYEDSPILDTLTVDQMQESYRIKLVDPERYEGVVGQVAGLPGVQAIQDLREYLDPLFSWMNLIQVATVTASGLLLLAAALQIGNTIRLTAFARRREIGIMRLVGASNFYIMLPFLFEAVIGAALGILLACATLASGVYFIIIQKAKVSLKAFEWIGWSHAGLAMVGVAVVGLALAIIPTLITTRKYLRV